MSAKYSTSDYFRDSYWPLDAFFIFLGKSQRYVKNTVRKIINFELESLVFRIIENIPYGIIILFLGFFLTVSLLNASEKDTGIRISSIATSSMAPKIKPGSLVVSMQSKIYRVGDIVTYSEINTKNNEYTGRLLTHRIIDVKLKESKKIYTLKGDDNENPDPNEVLTKDILGKIVIIIPYFGYIDFLIRTVPGFIIFILIPALLLIREAKRYAFDS